MTTPHKQAEVLRAIADGKEVEYSPMPGSGVWYTPSGSGFNPIVNYDIEWRIKPEPKPDIVRYLNPSVYNGSATYFEEATVRIVFDGETGKLKSAGKVK